MCYSTTHYDSRNESGGPTREEREFFRAHTPFLPPSPGPRAREAWQDRPGRAQDSREGRQALNGCFDKELNAAPGAAYALCQSGIDSTARLGNFTRVCG